MKVVHTETGWRRARITDSGAFWMTLAVVLGIANIAIPFLMLM